MKKITSMIQLQLEYFGGRSEPSKGVYRGGVVPPQFQNELAVWVYEAKHLPEVGDELVSTGGLTVNIAGSRRAVFELGRYLIALSRLETEDPGYHDHLDNLPQVDGFAPCELIVHRKAQHDLVRESEEGRDDQEPGSKV